jgi:hypothetical protein
MAIEGSQIDGFAGAAAGAEHVEPWRAGDQDRPDRGCDHSMSWPRAMQTVSTVSTIEAIFGQRVSAVSRQQLLPRQNVRASAGGPPTLQVGPSCDGVARGSVVLGRVKKACLADETTAQDTLKQNWSKYAAADKTQCTGMVTTGGPASYVELLSSVEILRGTRATSAMPMHSRPTTARSRVSAGVHRGSGWPVLPREGVPVDEAHQ